MAPYPYLDREDREYIPKNVSSGWTDYDISFPTQDMADRFDYSYGQMWNPQGGARDVGPWLEEDDYYNPNVFERQLGLASFPGAAKKYAELYNQGFSEPHFDSTAELRNLLGYVTAINADSSLINPMYADLYGPDDPNPPNFTPDMYTSKREQVEDEENTFVKMMMENYGRDNPLLQELGGMETTEVTAPRGDVTTTEEYIDDGYNLRELYKLIYGHISNLDSNNWPYGVRPPSQRPGGMDWRNPLPPSNIGYDRAGSISSGPPSNIGYDRAGPISSGPPSNIGYDRAGPISSGPPSNIGFARAGAEPALPPSDIGYDRAGGAPSWWKIW